MPSSYTEKQTKKMIDIYTENPCIETVERLMTILNRPKKSIISKLVKEGVYVTKTYLTKTGEAPITKLELVRQIEDALDTKLPGLDKAPKTTLKDLAKALIDVQEHLDLALEELTVLSDNNKVITDMLKSKSKKEPFEYL